MDIQDLSHVTGDVSKRFMPTSLPPSDANNGANAAATTCRPFWYKTRSAAMPRTSPKWWMPRPGAAALPHRSPLGR